MTVIATGVLAVAPTGAATRPSQAAAPERITGSGSTWSANALIEWRGDVARIGLEVDYGAIGSTSGRNNFKIGQTDFAVSEIPYAGTDQPPDFGINYLPIVAGGTALMYNLAEADGRLKLSPATIAGIFTGGILKWNDDRIKADNPGMNLPDLDIIPAVRSDGSGTSAQFAYYLSNVVPDIWAPFAEAKNIPAGYVSQYPVDFGRAVGANGSDGVADLVHDDRRGRGAIAYVETSYAKQRERPVAFVQNASGAFVLPTEKNVAIALTQATLNADRTQNLDNVFTYTDPSSYPISSYSYMIVPTDPGHLSPGKARTLSQFIYYFTCEGQQKAGRLGYSPLPRNLVQAAWDATVGIPGADPPPAMEDCRNPFIQGEGPIADPSTNPTGGAGGGAGGSGGGGDGSGGAGGESGEGGSGGSSGSSGGARTGATGTTSAGGATGTTVPGSRTSTGTRSSATGGTGGEEDIALGAENANTDAVQLTGSIAPTFPLVAAAIGLALVVVIPPLFSGFRPKRPALLGKKQGTHSPKPPSTRGDLEVIDTAAEPSPHSFINQKQARGR